MKTFNKIDVNAAQRLVRKAIRKRVRPHTSAQACGQFQIVVGDRQYCLVEGQIAFGKALLFDQALLCGFSTRPMTQVLPCLNIALVASAAYGGENIQLSHQEPEGLFIAI